MAGEILAGSENIPYCLQAVAAMTFERVAGLSGANRAIIEALAKEPVGRFTDEYRTRHALPVTSTLHTALAELTDAGLVEKTESVIRVSDPFFTRYILRSAAAVFA